jgi:hypothetical protein
VALIARMFVVIFAFAIAAVAAALVITIGFLPEIGDLSTAGGDPLPIKVLISLVTFFISGFALLPAMLVIAISEGFRLRSVIFWALAGCLIGLFCYYGMAGFFEVSRGPRRAFEVIAGAGIVAGLVYWALAGRKAGAWRASPSKIETK